MDRESLANSRFACSERERAVFEAGIKMGTIYHQFVGTPFNGDSVGALEDAIESAICVQPYVVGATVRIRIPQRSGDDRYSYFSLTGDMIDAEVTVMVGSTRVISEMRFDTELQYPLMFISDVQTDASDNTC